MPIIMPYLEKLLLKHFCRIFLTLKKRKQKRLIKNKKNNNAKPLPPKTEEFYKFRHNPTGPSTLRFHW